MVVTVSERKARETQRRREAAADVVRELKAFAESHGGRFFVFGSVAEGKMSFDSDFDVVVDFSKSVENDAVSLVEDACHRHSLPVDVYLRSMVSERFLNRIAHSMKEVS